MTTCAPDRELANAIVFCRVSSWLTGRRLVSLPFSDHCQPLVSGPEELSALFEGLRQAQVSENWKYIELRPLAALPLHQDSPRSFAPSRSYCFHTLDLRPSLDELMAAFHKDCVQRKIRRAERDRLSYEEGRSESLLRRFYGLQLQTRRRQKLPPQPVSWFRNLATCLGEKFTIRVASLDSTPVASIVTIVHKNRVVYKYGCSDESLSRHGGTQLLFWKMIQEAKSQGLDELDMGRSDSDNPGLIAFKDRWGACRSEITYFTYPAMTTASIHPWKAGVVRTILSHLPDAPLKLAGSLLYRHLA